MKEENVRKLSLFVPRWYHLASITYKYPLLPVGIIQSAIDDCNKQVAINTFSEMNILIQSVSSILEERREKSKEVIEIILLEHKKSAGLKKTENEFVNGILSIPHGVLLITLKTAHNMWNI
jgi:hypothetical protein